MICPVCRNIEHAKDNGTSLLHFVPLRSNKENTGRYKALKIESYDMQYCFGEGLEEYVLRDICMDHQPYLRINGFWVMPHSGSIAPAVNPKETDD